MNVSCCRAKCGCENELAEGVRLSKAWFWLWSQSFALNPALSRPASRTAFESSFSHATNTWSAKSTGNAIEGGGGGEIRTHEAFRPSGFQDRRDQPLCHPSQEANSRELCHHYAVEQEIGASPTQQTIAVMFNFRLEAADCRFSEAETEKPKARSKFQEQRRRRRLINSARRHRCGRSQLGSESRGTPNRFASWRKQGQQRKRSKQRRDLTGTRDIWN